MLITDNDGKLNEMEAGQLRAEEKNSGTTKNTGHDKERTEGTTKSKVTAGIEIKNTQGQIENGVSEDKNDSGKAVGQDESKSGAGKASDKDGNVNALLKQLEKELTELAKMDPRVLIMKTIKWTQELEEIKVILQNMNNDLLDHKPDGGRKIAVKETLLNKARELRSKNLTLSK